MRLLIWAAVLGCAYAFDLDTQSIKSVKGGRGGFRYQGGDISRFYNNSSQHGGFNSTYGAGGRPGQAPAIDFEVGVCYIEVPTSTLVRDPAHIPAGNGSRPDLSRIRTCCKGYTRNVYNFKICEPVCTQECVNALCTAPDTCTCYPDHVRNQAGVCVATCPIGCQNGHCDGGECLCKEGFKLDVDGRFCVPNCRHDCGGAGTCTAPNMCECRPGYEATSDGSCKLSCGKCDFGDCVSPTECRCRHGFQKDGQGQCAPHCSQNCGPNARCTAPNVCSPGHSPGSGPTNQLPNNQQMNSQNPYGPVQNQTSFYNPNHDPYGSLHPYDQNKPQPSQPNSTYPIPGSNYPQGYPQPGSVYPHPNQPQHPSNYPQNPNQPQPGSGYPQPYPIYHNQGSNQPQYPYGQNPQNPQYPSSQNPQNPQYPSGQNPQNPQYPYGQSPQNPQYPINTNTNQGQFNTQVETVNITYPQYPLYPDSQVRPNGTNQPGQQYPDSQRPNNYPPNGYNPQSPNHGYPTQQHGYYPYNQNSYDQTQESGLCAEPCVNGQCIDHNRCRCNPGYITDEMDPSGNRCRPHCPGGCPNGYCVAPHSCACNEGYYRDTSVKGRAVCIRRIRRSLRELVFKIPDYVDQ